MMRFAMTSRRKRGEAFSFCKARSSVEQVQAQRSEAVISSGVPSGHLFSLDVADTRHSQMPDFMAAQGSWILPALHSTLHRNETAIEPLVSHRGIRCRGIFFTY
jgi:hypothetical protein